MTHYKKHLRPARPLGDGPKSYHSARYPSESTLSLILTFATSGGAFVASGSGAGSAGFCDAAAGRFKRRRGSRKHKRKSRAPISKVSATIVEGANP